MGRRWKAFEDMTPRRFTEEALAALEQSRNSDPGEANVLLAVDYEIYNDAKTGTYTPGETPGAPDITAAVSGDGQITLSITAAAVTDVIYIRKRLLNGAWSGESETDKRTGSGTVVMTGLSNGQTYEFAAYAKTGSLTSDWDTYEATPMESSYTLTWGSAAYIILQLLEQEEIFTSYNAGQSWPIFISSIPDKGVEDDCGCVYDTTGMKDGRLMGTGETIFHQGVQVSARSLEYIDGFTKMKAVRDALAVITNVMLVTNLGNFRLSNITQTSPIISAGVEPGTRRRNLFTLNLLVTITSL